MIDQIRATIPLFVLFAGIGIVAILVTREANPIPEPPQPESMQSSTYDALLNLADDPTTAISACQTAYETGDTPATVDICTAALDTLPDDPNLHLLRGQAFELQALYTAAITDYRAAIREADPTSDLYDVATTRLEALTEDQ